MLIVTIPDLPGMKYVALGPVIARATGVAAIEPLNSCIAQLEKQARQMGADAVIGVQLSTTMYRTFNLDTKMDVLMGTAIKFADPQSTISSGMAGGSETSEAAFYRAQAAASSPARPAKN